VPFTVRPTGDQQLDLVQQQMAQVVAELERKIAALPTSNALQQTGITAGTTTPVNSITVDIYGRVTHVS
jgi:hypothetical protein